MVMIESHATRHDKILVTVSCVDHSSFSVGFGYRTLFFFIYIHSHFSDEFNSNLGM